MKTLVNIFRVLWGRSPTAGLWRSADTDFEHVLKAAARCPVPAWQGTHLGTIAPYIAQFIWYIKAPFEIAAFVQRYGKATAKAAGPSIFGQVVDLIRLAYLKRVSPEVYYQYKIYDRNEKKIARNYIHGSTRLAIIHLLNTKDWTVLEDKNFVSKSLHEHGIASVRSWVSAVDGELFIEPEISDIAPNADMILKPNDGTQGEGIELIRFVAKDEYEFRNSNFTFEEVLQQVRKMSESRHYLIQPCLRNHEQIRHFAPNNLTTLRILTAQYPEGSVEVLYAIFRVGPLGTLMDNFSIGGYAAPIDIQTGVAGLARGREIPSKVQRYQANSENIIEGTIIPFWEEVLTLCRRAHSVFPEFVSLGWDIAITDQGPTIIEVNAGWDCKVVQVPGFVGLGDTNFGTIARRVLEESAASSIGVPNSGSK